MNAHVGSRGASAGGPPPGGPADPGLQPERTSLAWNRTLLALVLSGALFLRWVPLHGWFPLVLSALTVGTAFVIAVGQARRYRRGVRGMSSGHIGADVVGVAWMAGAVALVSVLALVVVVALPLR
ncbi:DUF202 domain-containing protein [Arthrobacter echini]|uniref:DUF202 domain-containing protein n=1 Tax=Arthrobacter echini TaxID=1529066 RepID=A0A4V6S857_9MICC|nr:DUF202 domain-containing protein [Arthrobacter echini]THJ65779.1 DUF202 domain-containing protein [Arthrobacter echini]